MSDGDSAAVMKPQKRAAHFVPLLLQLRDRLRVVRPDAVLLLLILDPQLREEVRLLLVVEDLQARRIQTEKLIAA